MHLYRIIDCDIWSTGHSEALKQTMTQIAIIINAPFDRGISKAGL